MKILITGGTGQLGKELIKSKPINVDLIAPERSQLNLENQVSCEEIVRSEKPDWIINCGAYTNVDKAEIEKEIAFKINYKATETLSKEISKTGGNFLQISTDYVFDGKKNIPYQISDRKNPLNIYGESKSLAEDSVKKFLNKNYKYLILRTSWVMSPEGKNFIITILNLLQKKSSIKVIDDQWGSMTSTKYLANTCWDLINLKENYNLEGKKFPPVHHWCDEGILSWYEIATAICEISKDIGIIKNPARIESIKSKDYKLAAMRPKYSVLNCNETEKVLNTKRVNWRNSLLEILQSIAENKAQLFKD